MPFLRLTRDPRGYENTFLLHVPYPGARPRVLYLYRSAPGVRVGRPALDEDAIRTIEEQHPDIDFDWPHILEAGTALPPEVERRPERPRRARPREVAVPAPAVDPASDDAMAEPAFAESAAAEAVVSPLLDERADTVLGDEDVEAADEALEAPAPPSSSLLDQLVGREIATRLRARYAEVEMRIHSLPDLAARAAWQTRADALNPDTWVTPEEILRGVDHADWLFDELRRGIAEASALGTRE